MNALVGTIRSEYYHRWGIFTIERSKRHITERNDQWESTEVVQGQSTS
jgi:hypothetical protein